MHIKVIARLAKIVWTRYGKYRAELIFYDGPKEVFWLSRKQGDKLKRCATAMNINSHKCIGKVIAVFDDDRFVWCGLIGFEDRDIDWYNHTESGQPPYDLPYLQEHFKVKDEDVDLSTSCRPPDLEVPAIVEVDKELIDET